MKTIIFVWLLLAIHAWGAISAIGYGNTPKEAKEAALSELSNVVSANVKSDISATTTVAGGKVDKKAQTKLNVASNSYFQGVTYGDAVREGSSYTVSAHLSDEGVLNTINFLKKEIHQELAPLSAKALRALLQKSEMLFALANFTQQKSAIQEQVKAQEAVIQKYLSHGQIYFQTNPKNVTLFIGDQAYKPFETYLLPAKEHHYEISAQGYHTEKGKFYVTGAQKQTIKVTLIKQSGTTPLIYLGVQGSYAQSAQEVLTKYQVGISSSSVATNAIGFDFDVQHVTDIDDMKVYNLTVTATAYKGKNSNLVKRAKVKNVTNMNIESKKQKAVKALTQALLKELKMEQFLGASTVDYSGMF